MAVPEGPICPNCGTPDVRVAYTAPADTGTATRERIDGRCNTCRHEWTDDL